MTTADMLIKWLEFSKYDPDRKQFTMSANPLVDTYSLHKCNEQISAILNGYEPSGEIALIYAKNQFMWMVKNARMNLLTILSDPDQLAPYTNMYSMFTSASFADMESKYLLGLGHILETMFGVQMLGDQDVSTESDALYNAIDNVLDTLTKCKVDVYKCGGAIQQLKRCGANIRVFNLLSECLITLESSPDGMYMCYIAANGSMDGYFGFFIKSNGTLISIHDRIDEAYQGEHSGHRNNRYIENKKYQLFPYKEMLEFSGSDYKGYYTKAEVKSLEFPIKDLETERVFAIVLAMNMLLNKYRDQTFSMKDVVYVDSMLPQNLNASYFALPDSCKDLIVPGTTELVDFHSEYRVDFTTDDIKTGSVADRYNRNNPDALYYERGGFAVGANQLLVGLWGDGFELDTSVLLDPTKFMKRIGVASGEESVPIEFVGRKNRMDMAAYMQARSQLADKMRDNIWAAYEEAGPDYADNWWKGQMTLHHDKIIDFLIGASLSQDWKAAEEFAYVKIHFNETSPPGYYSNGLHILHSNIFAIETGRNSWKYRCPITGNEANTWLTFECETWKQMERLFEEEVPKLMKGYIANGHDCHCNQILDAHDPVEQVGTPWERDQRDSRYYKSGQVSCGSFGYGSDTKYYFSAAFGFSKRGYNQLVKAYKERHNIK